MMRLGCWVCHRASGSLCWGYIHNDQFSFLLGFHYNKIVGLYPTRTEAFVR